MIGEGDASTRIHCVYLKSLIKSMFVVKRVFSIIPIRYSRRSGHASIPFRFNTLAFDPANFNTKEKRYSCNSYTRSLERLDG